MGEVMNNGAPETTGKSAAMTLVSLLTLLCGGGYSLEGAYLILVWEDWLPLQPGDLPDRIVLQFDPASLAVIGVLFWAFGIMAVIAALGLFWRQQWGRTITLLVAVLAISLGFRSLDVGPPIVAETTNVPLGAAQILYGILAFAFLSVDRAEPMGVYIVRFMNFLVGLPTALFFALWVTEFKDVFVHPEGVADRDPYSRFTAVSVLSGFVAGLLLVASGTCLLIPPWKRSAPVVLMIAAAGAESALALFALLGAVLGHSGGLGEAFLLAFVLPIGIILLVLTVSGAWYLARPHIRRALGAEAHPAIKTTPPNV